MDKPAPLLLELAEKSMSTLLNAPEAGASMENDTKDPYSDNSDTN